LREYSKAKNPHPSTGSGGFVSNVILRSEVTKNLGVRRGAVRINPTTPRPFAEFILRVTEGLRVTLSGTFDTKPLAGEE